MKPSDFASLWSRLTMQVLLSDIETRAYEACGDNQYAGYMQLRKPQLFVKDLDIIKQILVKDFAHFVDRQNLDLSGTDPLIHNMLTNLGGQEWKDVRSAVSPTFTTGKIKRMFQSFDECAINLIDYLSKERDQGREWHVSG